MLGLGEDDPGPLHWPAPCRRRTSSSTPSSTSRGGRRSTTTPSGHGSWRPPRPAVGRRWQLLGRPRAGLGDGPTPSCGSIFPTQSSWAAPSGAPSGASVTRQELWNGNREPWSNLYSWNPQKSIIAWSATRHGVYRQRYGDAEHDPRWAGLEFVRLRSQREADALPRRGDGRFKERGVTHGSGTGWQDHPHHRRYGRARPGPRHPSWPPKVRPSASADATRSVCVPPRRPSEAVGGDVLAQRADVSQARDLEAFVEAAAGALGPYRRDRPQRGAMPRAAPSRRSTTRPGSPTSSSS